MAIPKKDFAYCFEKWKECWYEWAWSQGEYFEGDKGVIVLDKLCLFFKKKNTCNVLNGWILSRQTSYVSCVGGHMCFLKFC